MALSTLAEAEPEEAVTFGGSDRFASNSGTAHRWYFYCHLNHTFAVGSTQLDEDLAPPDPLRFGAFDGYDTAYVFTRTLDGTIHLPLAVR